MAETLSLLQHRSIAALAGCLAVATGLSACATSRSTPPGYLATLRTTAPAEAMSACIAQAVSATPTNNGKATVIDAANAQPPRRYTIVQGDGETIVTVQGSETIANTAADHAAMDCLQTTSASPPSL